MNLRKCSSILLYVVFLLILGIAGGSPARLTSNNARIPDELFLQPLVSQDKATNKQGQTVGTSKSSTLLEPIIIHHKGKSNVANSREELCQGACIPRASCDQHGGVHKGNCHSATVCCIFERSCGSVSWEKISFFRSPNYPEALNESLDCSFRVQPDQHTCALKVEFLTFELKKAVRYSKTEKCVSDALYVLNSEGGYNEPLCDMENHTAIVYIHPGAKPVKFLVIAQSDNVRWNLKITQVNCKKLSPWQNEPKCGRQLMYDSNIEEDASDDQDESKELGNKNALNLSPYIVNGKDAEMREFPWQISLQTKGRNPHHRCGGSIINSRFILTASHCLMRNAYETRDKLKVVVGDYNLNEVDGETDEEAKSYDIESIISHYHYKPSESHLNDIAIIKLRESINFSSNIQPVCLPLVDDFPTDGLEAVVSGWGRLNGSDPGAKASRLQKLKIQLISDKDCRKLVVNEIQHILKRNVSMAEAGHLASLGQSSTQLCGRPKLSSAVCFGDSGGALVVQKEEDGTYIQVGVVSYGLGKCVTERNPPAAYTRVSQFRQFIAIATES